MKLKEIALGAVLTLVLRHAFLFAFVLINQTGWPKTWWEPIVTGLVAGAAAFSVGHHQVWFRVALRSMIGLVVALVIFSLRARGLYTEFGPDFFWSGVRGVAWHWVIVMLASTLLFEGWGVWQSRQSPAT